VTLEEARQRATLTVPETASLLGVSQRTAYGAVGAGELPALRLGRRLLVPVPALIRWLGAEIDGVNNATEGGP
jgi:excisionase family DNA binding protein